MSLQETPFAMLIIEQNNGHYPPSVRVSQHAKLEHWFFLSGKIKHFLHPEKKLEKLETILISLGVVSSPSYIHHNSEVTLLWQTCTLGTRSRILIYKKYLSLVLNIEYHPSNWYNENTCVMEIIQIPTT